VLGVILFPTNLLRDRKLREGPSRTVPGKILLAEDTNVTINDEKIRKYRFSYQPDAGAGREGTAYTSGGAWREGASVPVRYLEADPGLALPVGARSSMSSVFGLVALVFPLMAGGVLIHSLYGSQRENRLLRKGLLGQAQVTAVELCGSRDNGQDVFKIHLTFADDGLLVKKSSHDPREILLVEERLASSEPVRVLYDPNEPRRLLFPESWEPCQDW
jgi:hypothetical protein